ncbi:MAG: undecaprenyl-phosphate galactose phosphotransferase WbaP [Synechococcales bacterium]|nr:undecaprenyl-phosphate galactose phosphotransferase WbaP [Synechococcales bacterium]
MQLNRTLRPALSALTVSTRSWPTIATMIGADLLGLLIAWIIGVNVGLFWEGDFHTSLNLYWQLFPLISLFILAYATVGLYPGVALSPVDELRWISAATTLVYLVLGSAIFLFQEIEVYSRSIFLMAWVLSLVMVHISRAIARSLFARQPWWGYPVIILGAGKTGEMVIRTLQRRPRIGLKPVLVLDDNPAKRGMLYGVPVVGGVGMAPRLARTRRIPYAIVAMPGVPRPRLLEMIERYGQTFAHLLIIPDLFGFASLWVAAKDLGGILGLEVRQQLLLPGPRLTKFMIDLTLTLIGGTLLLPILLLIMVLIRLDSPGPIFYGQERIGQGGRKFTAWKFRSMVRNADQVLKDYLDAHPDLREAWERDQKLRRDPRVTRVGRFLRRTSLDELPQLWNILRGEMSLVGPRPIVDEELWRYGDKLSLYSKVPPGLTGMWQVSGRNNITYEERVSLDAYYVRNWSVWLDIYILLRTVWVVIMAEGAY